MQRDIDLDLPARSVPGPETSGSLDPHDWEAFRELAHEMMDDAIDFLMGVRERPVWKPIPEEVKEALSTPLPLEPCDLRQIWQDFRRLIQPYSTGNTHPRFFGWVHGSGTPAGMLAEMLSASLNANLGGRDHVPVYVERRVIDWCKEIFGFPEGSSGLLVSGTSMANLIAMAVARDRGRRKHKDLGAVFSESPNLVAYASEDVHDSIWKVLRVLGLEDDGFRTIPSDRTFRIDVHALEEAIEEDRRSGRIPFLVVGTAGTVNTGAIDDLEALGEICASNDIWLHVDGAFGGLAMLSPNLRALLRGVERADSIAFDFHKWMHVPYDAGCILIRDGEAHRDCFSTSPSYLERMSRGLSGGAPWFTEFGPELSRGFRALKVWVTLKHFGVERISQKIEENCSQAEYLSTRVLEHPDLDLGAPRSLNIVCFRFLDDALSMEEEEQVNREIVFLLHEEGIAAPSTVRLKGDFFIRVNLTNHRCKTADLDLLVEHVVRIGRELVQNGGF